MSENKMEYRGSKSEKIQNPQPIELSVKEQREDGSWLLSKLAVPIRSLRYSLMGLETGYQVKIPAKQLINRGYSTYKLMINP
jgi:hypothetical protein